MTIGIPASRGTAQSAVAANSLAVTLTSSIAIGSHLILVFGNSGATGLSINSVVDSKGNSWAVDKYQGDNNSTGAYSGIASAKITTALTTSDTVTFTVSASVTHRMSLLYEITGLDPTTWIDQTNGAPGTGTSPASGTINTTSANELIMGACGWDSGTAASHTSTAPMTELDEIHTTGKGTAASYNIVSATGGYSDSGTIGSALWSDCVASYIAASVPAAITKTDLTAGADTTDQATYTTASITPSANKLQLIAVENAKSTLDAPSVTGCNLTWVAIDNVSYNQIVGPSKTVTILRAMGASPTTGTLTISFGGVLQNGCLWSLAEFDGVDTSGTNGSGAIVQSATNRSDAAASLTVTLAAFGSPYNAAYGAFGCISAPVLQAGSGYTDVNSNQAIATPTLNLYTEWRLNNTLVNASVASGTPDMGAVAIEIKASTAITPTTFSNIFEGGTDETTISVANSGGASGDAFTAVTIDVGGVLVYDSALSVHGSLSARVDPPNTNVSYVRWAYTTWADTYGRLYLYLTTNPPEGLRVVNVLDATPAACGRVAISASGKIVISNSAGTTIATSTTSVNLNAWFRLEFHIFHSTTVGQLEARLYNDKDASTPTETLSPGTNTNTGASSSTTRFGCTLSSASDFAAFWMDDINANNIDWPGPSVTSVPHLAGAQVGLMIPTFGVVTYGTAEC